MDAFYTGQEHGLVWAEYLSDDEYLADVVDLDAAAYRNWLEDEGERWDDVGNNNWL